MKSIKRVAALVMAILFVGVGVLSNVGTISQVDAAAKISTKKKTLKQGQKLTLKITGGKGTIKWSVNNDNVKLNKKTGKKVKVTAVKAGKSKVTANVKGKKLTCTIKVNGLNIVKKELTVGQSFKLKATGLGKKIKWSVNNKNVAIKVSKKVNVTATAKAEGTSVITAKVGKKSYKCTVVVKHVHKTVAIPGKAATCVEPGLTAGTKCSVCGAIVTAQKEIAPLAHETIYFEAVTPGCHSLGNVEYWYCPDCEGFWTDEACTRVTNSKSVNLPATGSENLQHVAAVEPTATENGNVEYWYCPDCEGYWLDEACTRLTNRLSVILGATGSDLPVEGSQDNPIALAEPTATVTVPAGSTIWYQGRFSGMYLVVEGTDALSVTHNGETTDSMSYWNGVEIGPLVGFGVTSFAVTNKGAADQEISISLTYPMGSYMNPEEVYGFNALYANLPAAGMMDNYEGYWFVYTPDVDETINLTIQDMYCETEGAEADFYVTTETPDGASVQLAYSADAVDGVLTVNAYAGVKVLINVVMLPDASWNKPEASVTIGTPIGTEANPEFVYSSSMDVAVGAGETYYLSAYASGNTLVIKGGDAVVTVDGVEYTAVDGVVSVEIPASAMPGMPMPTSIAIQNTTDAEVSYLLELVPPVGTMDNPEEVVAGESVSVDIAEGGAEYYYTYTATQTGTLEINVSANTGWTFVVNNMSAYQYGDRQFSDANDGTYTLEVTEGDIIEISVLTYDPADMWATPAGTITLDVDYASDSNMDVEEDVDDSYGEIF